MDKQIIEEKRQTILNLLRDFCINKLDEEYLQLAEKLIQKLARKRNIPFINGKPEVWAAAIIHALGAVNFLFDKSFEPYLSVDDINNYFGTNKSTTGNKSKQIRDMLKLDRWDSEFLTKKVRESDPFADLVLLDGFLVPIDTLPEEYQQLVRKTRAEGKDITFTTK